MDITPFVYPPNDQEGVEVSPVVSALFNLELDEGTVTSYNALLVKKSSDYANNSLKTITSKVTLERVNLLDGETHSGKDYGSDSAAGTKYRSRIKIEPLSPLDPHTSYSVILSKELGTNSVFDPIIGSANTGSTPLFKGPYTGLIPDSYEITIESSGSSSDTAYTWKRLSDNSISTGNVSRKRFIELEQGLFIKFADEQYRQGDIFTVHVQPLNKLNQIIAWNFSTGDASYVKPDDERSTSVVQLPVQEANSVPSDDILSISGVTPYDGQTMVKIGFKGTAVVNGIVFQTKEKTDILNNKKIKLIQADTQVSVYEQEDFIIEVLEDTTKQQVVDIVNQSTLPITATTSLPAALAGLHQSGVAIQGGEVGGQLIIKFNKTIDQTRFSASNIKASFESLTKIEQGNLDFSYEINDNVLKIQF
ncbi:MAG: hypothetical protein PHY47_00425 [Lachnospiraceae bacterium]|nr:hypothetical protein [Lachnospiraceae bacterium]